MATIQDYVREGHAHYGNCTRSIGSRGGVKEHTADCRVTGQLKTWKTRPDDYRLPFKYGMRGYGEIVPSNIAEFHLPSECPLRVSDTEVSNNRHVSRVQPVRAPILGNMEFHRAICSCGFHGVEHYSFDEAEKDRVTHVSGAMVREAIGNTIA